MQVIKIKMTMGPINCRHKELLPSGHVTGDSWYLAKAADINIKDNNVNVYDIYWEKIDYEPTAQEIEDGYQIYDWERPTAVICDGKDVTNSVTVIW